MMLRPWNSILEFWFGRDPDHQLAMSSRWFTSSKEFDAEIRGRFGPSIEAALTGEFSSWSEEPHGNLALVILLDQFTRNVFRGTPRAFAGDARALSLAKRAIEWGFEAPLSVLERAFLYMPFEHSELLEDQGTAVEKFEILTAGAPGSLRELCENFLDYARQHEAIIRRFGRFPHRNAILDRASTPEEVEFLKQPGSSF
jgi:uncharacterized protein (DUF924 family)